MKFKVQTPDGTGLMVKAFYKKRVKYCRVSFAPVYQTNKKGKKVMVRKNSVRDYLYSDCYIKKADSRLKRFIKKHFPFLYT